MERQSGGPHLCLALIASALAGAAVAAIAVRRRALDAAEAERRKKMELEVTKARKSSMEGGSSWAGPRRSVTVKVPATTANMGPGFDSIGMALDIWSEVTVERSDAFSMTCEGEGAEDIPKDDSNLVCVGVKAAFAAAGQAVPPLRYHCINRIPFARGLGSSSAAIVAGLIAGAYVRHFQWCRRLTTNRVLLLSHHLGLVLAGHELPVKGHEELLQLAAGIEGHPDNVAPAIYGGCQLCVLFIPEVQGKTSEARAILPEKISRKDAVYNIGRAAMLVNALNNGNLDELAHATKDLLHQPQRGKEQFKHLFPMIEAAIKVGAHGAFLSGAGPTVLAITSLLIFSAAYLTLRLPHSGRAGDIFTQRGSERTEKNVAEALKAVALEQGLRGSVFITKPVDKGAHIVRADPMFSSGVARFEGDTRDL